MNPKVILSPWRDPVSIPEDQAKELRGKFGPNAMFVRTDPKDVIGLIADYERLQPVAVVVPDEFLWIVGAMAGASRLIPHVGIWGNRICQVTGCSIEMEPTKL